MFVRNLLAGCIVLLNCMPLFSQEGGAALSRAPVFDSFRTEEFSSGKTPHFYPLGWGRQGRFAYMVIREEAGRGGFSGTLTICDMIRDEILLEKEVYNGDYDELAEKNFPGDSAAIASFLYDNIFERRLYVHDIEYGETALALPEFESFPFENNGTRYDCELDVLYNEELPGFDHIAVYDCWLIADNGTAKLVNGFSPTALNVSAAGVFKSPYENRVAIILLEECYTFEETAPFVVAVGSHMGFGFK